MTKFMNQKNHIINKLRGSGLRPTKQRILIAENLFENNKTFHFTIDSLNKKLSKKGNEKIYCEVKGTTGNKTRIILTRNEVLAAENNYPNGALFIVSGIYLNRSKTPPEASLGKLTELYNWKIDNSKLTPISYYYLIK